MFAKILRLSYWLVPILFVSLCPLSVNAQATAAPEKEKTKPAHPTQSVTGCLQKGDEPGEFAITGADGNTWGLYSKTVKLEPHIGHEVTVTGSATHESAAKEKAEEKKEGKMEKAAGKKEYGDLQVTDLKMISDTCKK